MILMGMLNCSPVFSGDTLSVGSQGKMFMEKQATHGDLWRTFLQKAVHPP